MAARSLRLLRKPALLELTAAGSLLVLGGYLRFHGYDRLSLWLDEGYTAAFARLSWPSVLGLHGAYDAAPPLYFSLVKLASLFIPEVNAGRLVSVIAGTLTIPVFYLLARRLMNAVGALVATALLTVSPVHVWYSQEGRAYALTVLLVALAYLALLAYWQRPSWGWAVAYGIAVLAAVYTSYSAVYAIAPQLLCLPLLARRYGRHAWPLIAAGALAVLAFVPWLPQIAFWVNRLGGSRTYLAVSADRLISSSLSIIGADGHGSYFYRGLPTAWESWPALHLFLLLAFIPAAVFGVLTLIRRSGFGMLLSLGLLLGTVAVAALLSLKSPGYAERTILAAVLGWAIIIGAGSVGLGGRWASWSMRAGLLSAALIMLASLVTLHSVQTGDKQHYRDLAFDAARAGRLGGEVVGYPTAGETLLEIYQPHNTYLAIPDDGHLPALLDPGGRAIPTVWLAYVDSGGIDRLRGELAARHYVRQLHQLYWYPLYLDLYQLDGQPLGSDVPVNGQFQGTGPTAAGWTLPQGAALTPDGPSGRILTLAAPGPALLDARATVPRINNSLETVVFQARSDSAPAQGRVYAVCVNPDGSWTQTFPDGNGLSVPTDGDWHSLSISAFCPTGSGSLLVILRNLGGAVVQFRDVRVYEAPPRSPTVAEAG